VGRVIVYFGDSVTADQAQFGPTDDPSKPWTVAESWSQHPDYDANLHHPDLSLIYLQHKLPFAPASLLRSPIRNSEIGSQLKITGWGASRALTPDLSQFEGVGIQRTARFPFFGSPTEADFVPAECATSITGVGIEAR